MGPDFHILTQDTEKRRMERYLIRILVIAVLTMASGCALDRPADGIENGLSSVSEEEMYLLYPQLLLLQENLDEANAYYYLGDIETSMFLSERLDKDIEELKSTSPAPYVCDRLDSLQAMNICLRERINGEESTEEWNSHMTSVLDSIAVNHIVEEQIEVVINWRTEHWLKYFQGRGRRYFTRWLERVEMYRSIIEPVLIDVGIPRDLLYLAVIESGLNLNARSNVKATGPWQFMAGTARLFGLRINWWIDERKDIVASTYAAANYLKHLHSLFGNWQLALAAYNSGEYRVAHAISVQKTDDYWKLRLPSQTRWFVPKYMAALEIGRDPAKYGFRIDDEEPVRFDVIPIDKSTDLRIIAKAAGCTLARIKDLNPALKRWATPPGMKIELKVPEGTAREVLAELENIPPEQRVTWLRHKIKKGETLSRIAQHYEISQSELKRINGISNVHRIRQGQILLIPTRDDGLASSSVSEPSYRTPPPKLPSKISMKKYTPPSGHKKLVYTVRDRDTLSEIAERFGVGLSKVRRWNNLRYSSVIHPGDNLVIYIPPDSKYYDTLDASSAGTEISRDGKKRLVHVVQKGETLYAICRRYKTRISDVLAWNSGVNKDRLYPGDRITIWMDSD